MNAHGRKRLISFLGTGNYDVTRYYLPDGGGEAESAFVAQAITRLLDIDEAMVLATEQARQTHGDAIRKAFTDAGLPEPQLIPFADGGSPDELWRNFQQLAELLEASGADEIILDITHGFRSQPFFAGAVVSYVRALRETPRPARVLYGAFDARNRGRTPVWDLTAFVDLVDWTQAIRAFLRTGNGVMLAQRAEAIGRELSRTWAQHRNGPRPRVRDFAKAVREFSDALLTVRTGALLLPHDGQASLAQRLADTVPQVAEDVARHAPPLAKVLQHIHEIVQPLCTDQDHLAGAEGRRVMAALASLYLHLGRHAEAAITLREGWVNLHAPPEATRPGEGLDREQRHAAELRMTRAGPRLRELAGVRNDIEHGGFRKRPLPPKTIHQMLERFVGEYTKAPVPDDVHAQPGATWFVTRHPGARQWAQRKGIAVDRVAEHLDVEALQHGDTVIGTLPVHLAAAVCDKGARYLHLSLDLPPEARGTELDADAMERYGARIEEFRIVRVSTGEEQDE